MKPLLLISRAQRTVAYWSGVLVFGSLCILGICEELWKTYGFERGLFGALSLYLPLWDYILVWGSKMTLSNCQKYLAVTVWLLPELWSLWLSWPVGYHFEVLLLVFISEDPVCVVYQLCLCCAPGCMPWLP